MRHALVPRAAWVVVGVLGAMSLAAAPASAHCDTMDGPVVAAGKAALAKADVTPVLMWVKKDGEAEVKAAFVKSLAVRTKGVEARDLADRYFFETLVRVHRAGEGEPFAGQRARIPARWSRKPTRRWRPARRTT